MAHCKYLNGKNVRVKGRNSRQSEIYYSWEPIVKNYVKFGLISAIIIGTLAWLAVGGAAESKSYYKTVSELADMGDRARDHRIRVGGDVVPGSIIRAGRDVHFSIAQEGKALKVVYSGVDPLPDTFKDGSQALADGKLGSDGVFHANKIQAKCASKYEAKPPQMKQTHDSAKPASAI
jgi:cytochrome c-type biogenesis protein CcmE